MHHQVNHIIHAKYVFSLAYTGVYAYASTNALVKTPGGGVLPYMGYIGMCGPKGYGFSAVLVINRVSIIAILPPLWS